VRPPASLTDAIADSLVSEPWVKAASASLELLKYEEPLRSLRGPSRWTAFADMAEIAVALVTVDEGLKAALPAVGLPNRRSLAAVRIAATAVAAEAARRPAERRLDELFEPVPASPIQIRRAADIPVALERISAIIRARGMDITMHDVGGVLQSLAQSLNDAGQVLRVAAWHLDRPEPVLEMARHADLARDSMKSVALHRMQVMTVGPPSHELIGQALELQGAMRTLLNYSGTVGGAANLGPARVSHEVASHAWRVLAELRSAVAAARDARQLLVVDRGIWLGERRWVNALPRDGRVAELLATLRSAERVARPSAIVQRGSEQVLGLASIEPCHTGRSRGHPFELANPSVRTRRRHITNRL